MKKNLCLLLFFNLAVAWPFQEAAARPARAGAAVSALSSSIISAGNYVNLLDGLAYPYQLQQLSEAGGRTTCAIWFPPSASGGMRPAVLITEPYAGVNWSSDPVDEAWTARFNPSQSVYPDVNGPLVNSTSGPIMYTLWTPESVPEEGLVCLSHGMGVLLVFERFYAGGTIADNVKDTTLGLEFLHEQSGVDPNRLGIFGISWGGFEAIYGAANAPAGAVPVVGVASSPPSDLGQLYHYATQGLFSLIQDQGLLAQRLSFYDPYVRRIIAGTVTSISPLNLDFSAYGLDFLRANLKTKFLVLHDQWDTMVPVQQSLALAAALPGQVQGLWYPHVGAIDYNTLPLSHGPVSPGLSEGSTAVFTCLYLLERLLPSDAAIHIPYHSSELAGFFAYMRDMQKQGQDISSLGPRLNDLADPRITMVDLDAAPGQPAFVSGAYWANYFLSLP